MVHTFMRQAEAWVEDGISYTATVYCGEIDGCAYCFSLGEGLTNDAAAAAITTRLAAWGFAGFTVTVTG